MAHQDYRSAPDDWISCISKYVYVAQLLQQQQLDTCTAAAAADIQQSRAAPAACLQLKQAYVLKSHGVRQEGHHVC